MTVSMQYVPNFQDLSKEAAEDVLYNVLIPACEAKDVKLSGYGNHNAWGSLSNVQKYNEEKASHQLFNVKRVQIAFAGLDMIVTPCSQYKTGSYGLKHRVEKVQNEYITNGDCIAAMILKGYDARFAKRGQDLGVNCEFKVKT